MVQEPAFPRRIAAASYFFLILLGIFFYVARGILYDTWNLFDPENVGVYALTIITVGFGVTGYLLYRKPAKEST
ncbi:MAG: hypothetical protein HY557_05510 [Euryarchaeota archaeon]|nr:hypothetical protein [Euryarchaeota archaeon]